MKYLNAKRIFVLFILFGYIVSAFFTNTVTKEYLYAISLLSRDIILFFLPFLVLALVTDAMLHLKGSGIKFMIVLFVCIFLSNYIAVLIPYAINKIVVHETSHAIIHSELELKPAFMVSIRKLITPLQAIGIAVIFGTILPILSKQYDKKICNILVIISNFITSKIVSPLIPIFIGGFLLKIIYDKTLFTLIQTYLFTFILIVISAYSYIILFYFLIDQKNALRNMRNILPATTLGIITMSSSLSLPLLIEGSKKNLGEDNETVKIVIPTSINFHLIGDAIAIPLLAMGIMHTFQDASFSFPQYLMFALTMVLAKFAVVTIPGGSILVLAGILEKKFGFTDTMSSLIITIYIVFDFVTTSANIFANGAFVIFMDKVFKRLNKKEAQSSTVRLTTKSIRGK